MERQRSEEAGGRRDRAMAERQRMRQRQRQRQRQSQRHTGVLLARGHGDPIRVHRDAADLIVVPEIEPLRVTPRVQHNPDRRREENHLPLAVDTEPRPR
eukprot:555371-Rhodomonas_salina.1